MGFFKRKKKEPTYEDNLKLLFGADIREAANESLMEEQFVGTKEQREQYVENCCEQMVACSKHIEEAKKEYNEVNEYLKDVQIIEDLPENMRKDLEFYAKRIVVLGNEKTGFKRYTSTMTEKTYLNMQTNERNMPKIIKVMAEDEEFCENVKSDLTKLEGEKLELRYDRRDYMSYINAMRNLTYIGFITLVIISIMMVYSTIKGNTEMGFVLLIVTIIAAVIIMVVFSLNRKLVYKLKVTELKLNKLIGISNSIKLKYVNVRVKLDYEYKEYSVQNAYELNQRYKTYLKAKKEQEAFARTADTLYQSVNAYNDLLRKLRLHDYTVWNSQVSAIIDKKEMVEIKHMLSERRQNLRDTIEYNKNLLEKTKEKIKKITISDKAHAKEILDILSKYENAI